MDVKEELLSVKNQITKCRLVKNLELTCTAFFAIGIVLNSVMMLERANFLLGASVLFSALGVLFDGYLWYQTQKELDHLVEREHDLEIEVEVEKRKRK